MARADSLSVIAQGSARKSTRGCLAEHLCSGVNNVAACHTRWMLGGAAAGPPLEAAVPALAGGACESGPAAGCPPRGTARRDGPASFPSTDGIPWRRLYGTAVNGHRLSAATSGSRTTSGCCRNSARRGLGLSSRPLQNGSQHPSTQASGAAYGVSAAHWNKPLPMVRTA